MGRGGGMGRGGRMGRCRDGEEVEVEGWGGGGWMGGSEGMGGGGGMG